MQKCTNWDSINKTQNKGNADKSTTGFILKTLTQMHNLVNNHITRTMQKHTLTNNMLFLLRK